MPRLPPPVLSLSGCEITAPGRGRRAGGASDASPDEGVEADLPIVDEKAVEQLAKGLISHYLPDLQRSKSALQELTQNQVVLLETLEQEITKFKECNSILDINALEGYQPVDIYGPNSSRRGCRTSRFPLNRKDGGRKKHSQPTCSKAVVKANICVYLVGLRFQGELCARLQSRRKGA
ncbi:biogenesis of lysosome-related organelles complex 1 subunit 6 isoform X1 [Numida meleagris]|uniref:biogenesis of lysosome-related organelles complex 1 subunit 6 isoform X1 n=1 Tax=Numida meleagris TaxID=8996 RepID=UPI000B3DEC1B|nr:biogenesis of lysosome-related organelles complex 1 subunit 6 isoform X1 [Numida meleagris]